MKQELIKKIQSQQATVGVIGLGYVGLPLSVCFLKAGFKVIGFDIDNNKVEQLNHGNSYIVSVDPANFISAKAAGKFIASTDFNLVAEADVLIICVPTPLGKHLEPDLSFVINTIDTISPYLRNGQLISLESTTYPGTTEEELRPRLSDLGFNIGQNIFLVYSPEREDPGNKKFSTDMIPKVVGGSTTVCLQVGVALYASVVKNVVPVSSTQVAEMTKLLENIYRSVNIGLVNELKIVTDAMGIDIWEVIAAAATKPFGFTPFYPGPGLGGHCIPIDPFYLTWKAKEYGVHTRFIELAGETNTAMPQWVISKIVEALNSQDQAVKGAKILILGIAYKKNVDDMRESPAVEIMKLLQNRGANIMYSDPYVSQFPVMRKYVFDLASVSITSELLAEVGCVVIATDHDEFNYDLIQQHSRLIVDTRGRYRLAHPNVVKA
jgi:UDP-N-acetyl-D-glucosamine dehydrogenase